MIPSANSLSTYNVHLHSYSPHSLMELPFVQPSHSTWASVLLRRKIAHKDVVGLIHAICLPIERCISTIPICLVVGIFAWAIGACYHQPHNTATPQWIHPPMYLRESKKEILTSFKRPKWPIRPNKRVHRKCCLIFENNKKKEKKVNHTP